MNQKPPQDPESLKVNNLKELCHNRGYSQPHKEHDNASPQQEKNYER